MQSDTLHTGPGSYPGRYADQASKHVYTVAHATAILSRQPAEIRGSQN